MKTIIQILFTVILLQMSLNGFSNEDPKQDTLRVPQNAIILAQTIYGGDIYYTMVDMDNHEMVIVFYYIVNTSKLELRNVLRTGIKINLVQQSKVSIDNSLKTN